MELHLDTLKELDRPIPVPKAERASIDDPEVFESAVKHKFQIYKDAKGEYRWRLRASNGETIADGNEGYRSKDAATHAINLLREQLLEARVEILAF